LIHRHGARLDAADKSWHLSSPTPYDPPLTYGGWTQCRALGTRIASLVHAREVNLEELSEESRGRNVQNSDDRNTLRADDGIHLSSNGSEKKRKRRKHKIVIHTSPFLRCVQTSIAISAGIAQYGGNAILNGAKGQAMGSSAVPRTKSPLGRIEESDEQHQLRTMRQTLRNRSLEVRPTVRIDAFLGEWLSPDYFEHITPPPDSTLMVAGAKADLLRKGDHIETPQSPLNSKGFFPGGWSKGGNIMATSKDDQSSPTSTIAALSQAIPIRERASSHSSIGSASGRLSPKGATFVTKSMENGVYIPPIPPYAVSTSDPIPRGYVAHAQEACTDFDYQWDSMRDPQYWPDGGVLGEEWSNMHKRFRKGINSMVAWYTAHGLGDHLSNDAFCAVSDSPIHLTTGSDNMNADEDTDLILVLVTHGAGCNALIGALTNQPVLMDVGMASLTMAVVRDAPSNVEQRRASVTSYSNGTHQHLNRQDGNVDAHLADSYDVCLLASMDHLRPGADPGRVSQFPSPRIMPMNEGSLGHKRRIGSVSSSFSSTSSPIDGAGAVGGNMWSIGDSMKEALGDGLHRRGSSNASLGSMRRSSQTGPTPGGRTYSPVRSRPNTAESSPISTATGLWGMSKSVNGASAGSVGHGTDQPNRQNKTNIGTWTLLPSKGGSKAESKAEPRTLNSTINPSSNQATGSISAIEFALNNPTVPSTSQTSTDIQPTPSAAQLLHQSRAQAHAQSLSVRTNDATSVSPTTSPVLAKPTHQLGLWGSKPLSALSGDVQERVAGPKRRWTVSDRDGLGEVEIGRR
jgi:hypothetical protein